MKRAFQNLSTCTSKVSDVTQADLENQDAQNADVQDSVRTRN